MSQIFISYVEEDGSVAEEIATGLEAAGYRTWYYFRDSLPGPSYLDQTAAAISQSDVVILVISADSLGSWQVDKEIDHAHERGKRFIPVLRGIPHAEFQTRQPKWRMAIGTAASILVPPQGIAAIMPRILGGLKALGIITEHLRRGELERAQGLIRKLGKEALAENGDWVLLHRERPLEVAG